MAFYLHEVYRNVLPIYQIKLVAGKKGLDSIIEWVHVIEDEQVSGFLSGNELVFTTGIAHQDNTWLGEFVHRLKEYHACGLVVNLGRHIHSIPQPVIDFCEQNDFPLFTIPWPTKIVDMSRHICRMIIQREQTEISISNAFYNAIFSPQNENLYKNQLERYGFPTDGKYRIALAGVPEQNQQQLKFLSIVTDREFGRRESEQQYNISLLNNQMLIVAGGADDQEFESMLRRISALAADIRVSFGLSEVCGQVSQVGRLYRQAVYALKIAAKNGPSLIRYTDLGIYKLLLQVGDKNVLLQYFDEVLGELSNYDKLNGTDYMQILYNYLKLNGSVQAVADRMYVHRNTINYKLKKISGILKRDFSQEENRVRAMLAFKVMDIL